MKNEPKTKEEARAKAIEWQNNPSGKAYNYYELYQYQEYFYKLGKKFGLVREFRENGII